jgi:sulfate transport system ATP-binding protein
VVPAAREERGVKEVGVEVGVEGIAKGFGDFRALKDVSFTVPSGALGALLGPSGSGKTTLLRILAGLEMPDAGVVRFDGHDITRLAPRQRSVGFVFQSYALFQHMTVAQNVAFGLAVRHAPKTETAGRVHDLLALTGLSGMEHRFPAQLSGGERQRVALARALAPAPQVLLLDEPFAAIDAKVREELRQWIRHLHDQMPVTSILVTHDQEEAFSIADRVVVMCDGRVEQVGTPAEVIDQPASEFVARFVGEVNVLEGVAERGVVACGGGLRVPAPDVADGTPVRLTVRSNELSLRPEACGEATVRRIVPLGDRARVHAVLDDETPLLVRLPRDDARLSALAPGQRVRVHVRQARVWPRVAPAG